MAEDFVLNVDFDISEAEAKQKKLDAQYKQSQNKIKELENKILDAKNAVEKLKKSQSNLSAEYKQAVNEAYRLEKIVDRINAGEATVEEIIDVGGLEKVTTQYDAQIEKIQKINSEFEKNEKNVKKQEAIIGRSNAQLIGEKANLDMIGAKIVKNNGYAEQHEKAQKRISHQLKNGNSSLNRNLRRMKELVKSALVFSVITKAFTSMRDTIGKIVTKDSSLMKQWNQLKFNLQVIGFQLYDMIKPALEFILKIATGITKVVSFALSAGFGKTAKSAKEISKSMDNTVKSTEKIVASFDTLQTAPGNQSDVNTGNSESMDYSQVNDIDLTVPEKLASIIQTIKEIIVNLAEPLKWIWDNIIIPFITFAGGILFDLLMLVLGALKEFSDWCVGNRDDISLTTSLIIGFLASILMYATVKKISSLISAITESIKKLGKEGLKAGVKTAFCAAAFGILAAGIIYACANWNKMSGAQKVITILGALAAAATAAAVAIAVFHTAWTIGVAAAAIAGGLTLLGLTFAFTNSKKTKEDSQKAAQSFYDSYDFNSDFKLPALATGAVIPGGKPFIAMLGDQRAGQTNIEAPLDTIVEAFKRAGGGQPQNITITAEGSMAQFIKMLNLKIKQENDRASVW